MKKLFNVNSWRYLIAFLVPTFLLLTLCSAIDNDSWFCLAEGRQIVEHGIYYTDELSMHEDLDVTVHNYGFAILFYLAYTMFDTPGLYLITLLLNLVIIFFLYRICMLLSNKNINLSLILASVADSILALCFVSTRGQMISYIIFLALIYVLELFIKTDRAKYLWWIPILSLISINMRAAMWWLIFIVIAAYLIDGIKKSKLHFQGYRTKPIILASLVAFLVGFINPYGFKMITFIFSSYLVPEISNIVSEMHPFKPISNPGLIIYLALVGVLWLYFFAKKKDFRIRHLVLFFILLLLGLNSVKSMAELILFMFLPLALLYRNWQAPRPVNNERLRHTTTNCVGIMTIALTASAAVVVLPQMAKAPSDEMAFIVDIIDSETPTEYRQNLKVYTGFNDGGYLEFRGYHPYLDPRAEVFIDKNNHKENILKEWEELESGEIENKDFLDKYNFDYLVISSYELGRFYNLHEDNYELIYNGGEKNDEGKETYRLYKRIKSPNE